MCGIFGAIGQPDQAIIRALAIANRDRGLDSLGFFNSTGKMAKNVGDPVDVLRQRRIAEFLADPKPWFIVGHTRYATRGKVSKRNAHPFRKGRIAGVHNGTCDAPREYAVDSEYLFARLNDAAPGDYQAALGDVSGYWSLAWFDGADLYLSCHGNSVALAATDRAIYFSSESRHLKAATGAASVTRLSSGQTIRFDMKLARRLKWVTCPEFVSRAATMRRDWRTSGKSYWWTTATDGGDDTAAGGDLAATDDRAAGYYAAGPQGDYLDELAVAAGFRDGGEAMDHLGYDDPLDAIFALEEKFQLYLED